MEENEFSWWLFEGRLRQCKNVLPDGLNWLCYFAGSSNSHRDNSISFISLESSHQVHMKNVVKSSKHSFGYFNTLETDSEQSPLNYPTDSILHICFLFFLPCIFVSFVIQFLEGR